MKINEVITEGAQGKLKKSARASIPDLQAYTDLDNNNHPYLAYRFGIALAGAPNVTMDRKGPIGSQFATIAYSDGDELILDAAKRMMHVKSTQKTSRNSEEISGINTTSPITPKGPVKRKSK